MKAAVYHQYGPPEVVQIEDVPKPAPAEHEVSIKVVASTVSSGDARLRRADPFVIRFMNGLTKPRKIPILGFDIAGDVESVGPKVTRFKPGDRIFGGTGLRLGAHAEFACVSEKAMLTTIPKGFSYEEAAAIPFGASAALHFLQKGNIRPGDKVLIYGASGSLGTAAIQLAKHFGAKVFGLASGGNEALVKSLGADEFIDYTRKDLTNYGVQYDIIFDTIGKSPFFESVKHLKKNGKYLRAVHLSLPSLIKGLWTSISTSKKVIGGVASERFKDLEYISHLMETGALKPVIDRIFNLNDIVNAHRYVDQGRKRGNVVIKIR